MASTQMTLYLLGLQEAGYNVSPRWDSKAYAATDAIRKDLALPRVSFIDYWIIHALKNNNLLTLSNPWADYVQLQTESGGKTPDLDWWKVQGILIDLNLYKHAWDGLVGPRTRDAIKQFQDNNGLPSTGYIDDFTARLLLMSRDPSGFSRNIDQIRLDDGTYINLEDVEVGGEVVTGDIPDPSQTVNVSPTIARGFNIFQTLFGQGDIKEEQVQVSGPVEMEEIEVVGKVHPLAGWLMPLLITGGVGLLAVGAFFSGYGTRSEAGRRLSSIRPKLWKKQRRRRK